jgi:hypothetical protein
VWWCDATRKIARQRLAPQDSGEAATLGAARNDREAVQVVVRAEKPLAGLTATVDALKGPGGAEISAEQIKILRVAYHFVHHPTDKTGVCDWWPDALPPLDAPVDVPAGQNQPLWVLVHVPKTAAAGDYEGMLRLKAEGWSADVPLRLRVWDFTLPDRNHLATAFGLTPETVFEYHQLKTDADKRRVLDMYHESFGEHRISPYDPAPLDPIGVKFLPDATPPRAEVDFARFEAAAQRAFDRFGFSHFMLHMQGMGGGTFHERYEPTIGRYTADSPQYQGAFASYVEQLQKHLDRKGWLGREYIYWFDEPDPKDYQFVRTGMQRIKQHAPRLTTMLTEEPGDELAGAIDIWCPVTFNYVHADAQRRKAAGERIWWYVCCGPKAPFCTLFIDHPATELRVWLWQTWQHDVDGILIWSANYWHSDTAFPDAKQNPYDDPMGYVSGYGVPKGTKQHWGNGDGRFVYPPLRAAVPGHAGNEPVIEPPVSSIRWEMLREGIEDWEYLYKLRELLRANPGHVELEELLKVPAGITTNLTTFTADPAPIYQRRQQIAEAIERLSKARP